MGDLTKHFSRHEFACHCGCGADEMDPDFLVSLENLRETYGKPMFINSGKRCKNWNDKVGGEPDSQHLVGKAVDVRVKSSQERFQFVKAALVCKFRGLGVAKDFVHVDTRIGDEVIFTYHD